MINFCKHLQLNENTDAAFGILQCYANLFSSITGTCISPEADFPSAYALFLR